MRRELREVLQRKLLYLLEAAEAVVDMDPHRVSRSELVSLAARLRREAISVIRYIEHAKEREENWQPEGVYLVTKALTAAGITPPDIASPSAVEDIS